MVPMTGIGSAEVSTDDFPLQCSIEMNKMRIPVRKSGKETS